MKKILLFSFILSATCMTSSVFAGELFDGVLCNTEDNSVNFYAKASAWDRIADNSLYITITTNQNRKYSSKKDFTYMQRMFYSVQFSSILQQANRPNEELVSYEIHDAFGTVSSMGDCI